MKPPMNQQQTAQYMSRSEHTLKKWRQRGMGPRWFRPAGTRHVLYAVEDVEAWLEAARQGAA